MPVIYLKKFVINKTPNFFSVFNNTANCGIGSAGWLMALDKRTVEGIPVLDNIFDLQI